SRDPMPARGPTNDERTPGAQSDPALTCLQDIARWGKIEVRVRLCPPAPLHGPAESVRVPDRLICAMTPRRVWTTVAGAATVLAVVLTIAVAELPKHGASSRGQPAQLTRAQVQM